MQCVQRGLGFLGEGVGPSTIYFIQERSGRTLEQLADTPDELIIALRRLFGLGSALIFSSIRKELILSSVGNHPLNGRLEGFLFALKEAKESVESGIA